MIGNSKHLILAGENNDEVIDFLLVSGHMERSNVWVSSAYNRLG